MVQAENVQLCPNCQTGQSAYLLDSREPFCPFLHLHNGSFCRAYSRIKAERKEAQEINEKYLQIV